MLEHLYFISELHHTNWTGWSYSCYLRNLALMYLITCLTCDVTWIFFWSANRPSPQKLSILGIQYCWSLSGCPRRCWPDHSAATSLGSSRSFYKQPFSITCFFTNLACRIFREQIKYLQILFSTMTFRFLLSLSYCIRNTLMIPFIHSFIESFGRFGHFCGC